MDDWTIGALERRGSGEGEEGRGETRGGGRNDDGWLRVAGEDGWRARIGGMAR